MRCRKSSRPLIYFTFLMILVFLIVLVCTRCGKDKEDAIDSAEIYMEPTVEDMTVTEVPAENGWGLVPESAKADLDWFADAAFVGDSVTYMLEWYQSVTGYLGDAQFFSARSLGSTNAMDEVSDESVHPSYNGEKMKVEDCIEKSGAKKLYIMLGLNDLYYNGVDGSVENMRTLIHLILEKSPDVTVFVESTTPIMESGWVYSDELNNEVIKEYDAALLEMCEEEHWYYVDVASVCYDEYNDQLNPDYCSDPDEMGIHFNETGCDVWIDYLLTHVPADYVG